MGPHDQRGPFGGFAAGPALRLCAAALLLTASCNCARSIHRPCSARPLCSYNLRLRGGMPKRNLDAHYEDPEPTFEHAPPDTLRARRIVRVRDKDRATAGSSGEGPSAARMTAAYVQSTAGLARAFAMSAADGGSLFNAASPASSAGKPGEMDSVARAPPPQGGFGALGGSWGGGGGGGAGSAWAPQGLGWGGGVSAAADVASSPAAQAPRDDASAPALGFAKWPERGTGGARDGGVACGGGSDSRLGLFGEMGMGGVGGAGAVSQEHIAGMQGVPGDLQRDYDAWAKDFCEQTQTLSENMMDEQREIWSTGTEAPPQVKEAISFLCDGANVVQKMQNLTDTIRQLENTFQEHSSYIRLENEALRHQLKIANQQLKAATSAAVVSSPLRPADTDTAPSAASTAEYPAVAANRHVGEEAGDAQNAGPRSGMAKRVARGGLERGGSGWQEEEAEKAGDSDTPSGDPAIDTRKAWTPKGDMTSRSFDMSQGVVGGGGRRGVAGSLVVRGLCQNVTESAVLSLFDHVASGDGVGEGDGGKDGIKSVRLLPLNRRYPSRVAYVNFASAAALHAGLRLDGMVPVWNLGSPLQVLRQESPGDSTQDVKAPEGGERTRYGELHTLTPRAMPQFKEHNISSLTPAPAALAAGGASKSGITAGRGEGGGLPTSFLFGISPVAPRSMGQFVSPFAKGPPTVDDGGTTTLVTPSVDSSARAPSSAAAELGSLSKQAHLHVPEGLFGDAAGGNEGDSGSSIWRGNASGLGARTHVSGSAKMDFLKPNLSREEEDAQEEAQKFAAQPSNSLGPAPRSPNKTAAVASPFLRDFMASQHQDLVPGGSVNTSSFLSNNPFLKPFTVSGGAGVAGSGLLWGQQETSSSGLFNSLAANSSSGLFRSLAANSFFPSAGVSNPFLVAGKQEEYKDRNGDEESAGDVEREVEIDPNSAIYKAEKVDVKTGEEDEETFFTLEKAKLFEYQKSEDDTAGAGSWIVKGVGFLRLNKNVGTEVNVGEGAQGSAVSNAGAKGVSGVRVVMRKIGNMELILNSRLFAGMACKKGGEKAVIFSGMRDQGLVTFLVRTSTPAEANALYENLLSNCPKA